VLRCSRCHYHTDVLDTKLDVRFDCKKAVPAGYDYSHATLAFLRSRSSAPCRGSIFREVRLVGVKNKGLSYNYESRQTIIALGQQYHLQHFYQVRIVYIDQMTYPRAAPAPSLPTRPLFYQPMGLERTAPPIWTRG
jgi:hypothetical protein